MDEKPRCCSCGLGREERIVGNGITEPPYLCLIRCPFDNEYYKYPDDECTHKDEYKK